MKEKREVKACEIVNNQTLPKERKRLKSTLRVVFLLRGISTQKPKICRRPSEHRCELRLHFCGAVGAYLKLRSSFSENKGRSSFLEGML